MSVFTGIATTLGFGNAAKEAADRGVTEAIHSNDAYTQKAIGAIEHSTPAQVQAIKQGATQSAGAINKGAFEGKATLENTLGAQTATLSPYTKMGGAAVPALMQLLGIGGQGPGGIQQMLQNMPGYQFAKSEGIGATESAAGAMGMGLSGNTLRGIDQFSTGLADRTYQSEVGNLMGVAGMGQQASSQLAQEQGQAGLGVANISTNQGTQLADIFSNQATNLSNIYGAQGTNLANLYSGQGINDANLLAGKGANDASIIANEGKSVGSSLGNIDSAGLASTFSQGMGGGSDPMSAQILKSLGG